MIVVNHHSQQILIFSLPIKNYCRQLPYDSSTPQYHPAPCPPHPKKKKKKKLDLKKITHQPMMRGKLIHRTKLPIFFIQLISCTLNGHLFKMCCFDSFLLLSSSDHTFEVLGFPNHPPKLLSPNWRPQVCLIAHPHVYEELKKYLKTLQNTSTTQKTLVTRTRNLQLA